MLRILGSTKRFCDGIHRRDALWAGGLSLFGLGLADYLRASADPKGDMGRQFGKAKACILLYLYGSPSQLELADMKPNAPVEIRGELKPIRSSLPGCDVCELLPHTSKIMHHITVLRSLTHKYPIHGVAYATTGVPEIDVPMELNPRDARHWPYIGSVVAYLEQMHKSARGQHPPSNIALPWPFSSQRMGEVPRAGPYAAFLGNNYQPLFTSFLGKATAEIEKTLNEKKVVFKEPYVGIDHDCRFSLGEATTLPADISLDRLDRRASLREQLETARRTRDNAPSADPFREMAYQMIRSNRIREALDVRREPMQLREKYGMTVFGQGALAARRLVEAGSRFVTVFWDEFGLAGSGWDTHWEHYPRLKNELMPGFDKGFSGLIDDLHQRGMLDDTLVVVLSEHGRTPKISSARGGGRDHWSLAYSSLLAGGGIARGKVVGKTDNIGGTIADRPVSPKDLLATIYHLLGYNLETTLRDRTNRPQTLVPGGSVVTELLA